MKKIHATLKAQNIHFVMSPTLNIDHDPVNDHCIVNMIIFELLTYPNQQLQIDKEMFASLGTVKEDPIIKELLEETQLFINVQIYSMSEKSCINQSYTY